MVSLTVTENFFEIIENEGEGVQVLEDCPFHPDRYLFKEVEESFSPKRSKFRCRLCSSMSRTKEGAYEHAVIRHETLLKDSVGHIAHGGV